MIQFQELLSVNKRTHLTCLLSATSPSHRFKLTPFTHLPLNVVFFPTLPPLHARLFVATTNESLNETQMGFLSPNFMLKCFHKQIRNVALSHLFCLITRILGEGTRLISVLRIKRAGSSITTHQFWS